MQTSKLFKIAIVIAAVMPAFALTACKQEIECEHWYEEVTIRATCTTEGHIQVRCAICRNISWDEKTPIIPSAHVVALWDVTEEATCVDKGSRNGFCGNCEKDVTETVLPLGHRFSYSKTTKQPGCVIKGEGEGTCGRCRKSLTYDILPLGHSWIKREGFASGYNCSRCGIWSLLPL